MRYLHPANHHSTIIRKRDEKLADKLHFEDIKFPVKIEDIQKVKKRNSLRISVFGYKNKIRKKSIYRKNPYIKKWYKDKHISLLSIGINYH